MPKNDSITIARINFPMYTACSYSNRHIVVGGGGGSSRTGIFNGFSVHELHHDGRQWTAREVVRHDTGSQVVMNCAIHDNGKQVFLAVGQDADAQIYQVKLNCDIEEKTVEQAEKENDVRQRKGTKTVPSKKADIDQSGVEDLRVTMHIQAMHRIQTDYSKKDPCQNVIRVSSNGKFAVTGGADGFLRLWEFPMMNKVTEIKAHDKEVGDADISPNGKLLVSVAKAPECIVWDVKTGKSLFRLPWAPEGNDTKYWFKRCRFGKPEKANDTVRLFTITNPLSTKRSSYVQLWAGPSFELKTATKLDSTLSALAVSSDGKYVAVGSMTTGNVDIFISFSLQRLKHIEGVHKTFVTALEFLPQVEKSKAKNDALLLSLSVDNQLCLHNVDKPLMLPAWLVVSLIIIILVSTFMMCSYLGL